MPGSTDVSQLLIRLTVIEIYTNIIWILNFANQIVRNLFIKSYVYIFLTFL